MDGSQFGLLEIIKSVDKGFYYLMVTMMILILLTFLVAVYAALRTDKLWALIKRQHDIAEIKKEVTLDLRSKSNV